MASFLPYESKPFLFQDFDDSSWLGGFHIVTCIGETTMGFSSFGISPCFKSSRYSWVASFILAEASSKFSPSEMQPGSEGIVTEYPPLSSGSKIAVY